MTAPSTAITSSLSPNVRKFAIFGAALVVVIVAIALIRRKTSVSLPVA